MKMRLNTPTDLCKFLLEETYSMHVVMCPAKGTPWNVLFGIPFLNVEVTDEGLKFSNDDYNERGCIIFGGDFDHADVECYDDEPCDEHCHISIKFKDALPVEVYALINRYEDWNI